MQQIGELLTRLGESFARHSGERRAVELPARQRSRSAVSSRSIPSMSSGATTTPGAGLPEQLGGGPVGRDEREDRPLGRQVLEHLAGEDAPAAPARLGDQEQERLGVALQLERRGGAARRG